jgi:hypothetical protein
MPPDVAEGRSAQKGIADGVKQNIGIRVAQQASVEGNLHPAENKGSSRDQPVGIIAEADANHFAHLTFEVSRPPDSPRKRRPP